MNLESGIQSSPKKAAESFNEPTKQSKISYTKDFLLSLSGLDVCKKLPSGFDQSILSEFEDASHGTQDWQRIPGSFLSQSYRRNEYGSSPPTRGDSGGYSRGIHGRWDNRTSGRNERESDSQSDKDSDSGRHYGNQSRRSWQSPEHDGLLGSGSFPKPSGYPAGMSASKVRPNDHYQLNRSNEPYHPPRPYKAVPHLRKENNDSYNDETFGSTECTSQDKAEMERRRRESFELMRKEQQKALQEKQKLNPDKLKGDISDVADFIGTKDGQRVFNQGNEFDESMTRLVLNNDTSKSSLQTAGPRPLVPPGFKSTVSERSSGTKPLSFSRSTEDRMPEIEESYSHPTDKLQNGIDNQEMQSSQKIDLREPKHENMTIRMPTLNKEEEIVDSSANLGISHKKLGLNDQLCRISSLSDLSETQDGSEVELDTKRLVRQNVLGEPKLDNSKSILEKLFDSALIANLDQSSGFSEHHGIRHDDTWHSNSTESSKFAHWFLEAEKKAVEDPPPARPSDLLSFIVGGEKGGSQLSNVKTPQHILPDCTFQGSETPNEHLVSDTTSSRTVSNQEAVPAILTCEDLEQTILSEYSESSSTLLEPIKGACARTEETKDVIDDHASQHLLSLLQKGTECQDFKQSPNINNGSSDKLHVSEGAFVGGAIENSEIENAGNNQSGKTLTLETLFGSAFMKELQSVGAPVSVQRGSVGSARMDISDFPGKSSGAKGDCLFPASTFGIGSSRSSQESNISQSSQTQQYKLANVESWSGIGATQVDVDPSKRQNDAVPKLGGFDGTVDIQLPEEESLIILGNPVNAPSTRFMPAENSAKGELPSSNKPVNIAEKQAALNTIFKAERPMISQEGPSFVRGPDPRELEIPLSNLHTHPLSAQFHPPQMNHRRPFFHPLDSHNNTHVSSQMNFMTPEGVVHHDAPASHQFPTNMLRPPFHHPNVGPAGFDIHHPILQPRQMPGNIPPPHLLRENSRGGPVPPHTGNHARGFIQELHPMQGLHLGQQQPNFGGLGMPSQAPEISGRGNHPTALQRLFEMEMRANAKQIRPLAAGGHSQGMHGHELDMGFRFR